MPVALTAFLLARLAEVEEVARSVPEVEAKSTTAIFTSLSEPTGTVEMSPARVLAECEAKRRIVEREHVECAGHPGPYQPHGDYGVGYCGRADEQSGTLLDLASVYSDHPDYDEAWRV